MIDLTEEQLRELEGQAPPVYIRNPKSHETFVLVRQDIYERLQGLLAADTVYATAELVDRVMAEDDVNDPHLETYQKITRKDRP